MQYVICVCLVQILVISNYIGALSGMGGFLSHSSLKLSLICRKVSVSPFTPPLACLLVRLQRHVYQLLRKQIRTYAVPLGQSSYGTIWPLWKCSHGLRLIHSEQWKGNPILKALVTASTESKRDIKTKRLKLIDHSIRLAPIVTKFRLAPYAQ